MLLLAVSLPRAPRLYPISTGLGLTLTLGGQKVAEGIKPVTDGYRAGDLDGTILSMN